MKNRKLTLTSDNLDNLENFSVMLNKDVNTIINKALEEYFKNEKRKLLEKNIADENTMTNLDFDEFWDDVEI